MSTEITVYVHLVKASFMQSGRPLYLTPLYLTPCLTRSVTPCYTHFSAQLCGSKKIGSNLLGREVTEIPVQCSHCDHEESRHQSEEGLAGTRAVPHLPRPGQV